jgi:hypothetical protein
MKVKELIDQLEKLPPELTVYSLLEPYSKTNEGAKLAVIKEHDSEHHLAVVALTSIILSAEEKEIE